LVGFGFEEIGGVDCTKGAMGVSVLLGICMYAYVCACTCACVCVHVYEYVFLCMCVCICVCQCAFVSMISQLIHVTVGVCDEYVLVHSHTLHEVH